MKILKTVNYLISLVLSDFLYFVLITIGFHFIFRFWTAQFDYWPFKHIINEAYNLLSKIVFEQSAFMVSLLLKNKVSIFDQQFVFINNGIITIGPGCSGFKQILQFIIVFLFIRGSILKKLWFIPLGILLMHLTNLFRVISLSVIIIYKPEYWQLSHDYILRPFFYIVIFISWLVWIEAISPEKLKSNIKPC